MDDLMYSLNMLNQSVLNAANIVMAAGTKKQDRNFSREMYQRQLEDNRENWRMMNEYNSPSAQRERLRAAGLNDNLIYGSGGVVGTTQLPNGANYNAGYSQSPRFEITDNFGAYMQLRQFERQMELQEAQIKSMNADASLKNSQASYYNSQTTGQNYNNWLLEQSVEWLFQDRKFSALLKEEQYYNYEMYGEQEAKAKVDKIVKETAKITQEIANMIQQNNLTRAQISSVLKDIEVKNASIQEIQSRTEVNYEQAEKIYYDGVVSQLQGDQILYNMYFPSTLSGRGAVAGEVMNGSIPGWTGVIRDAVKRQQNSNLRLPVRMRKR